MDAEPSPADDEATLAGIADDLRRALVDRVPAWLRRSAHRHCPSVDPEALDATVAATMAELAPALERVLTADVDAGAGTPLATVRAATGPLTDLLLAAGAAPVPRDDFDARAFPDDVFGLGPAAFADIDESLHELGITWGAARAHVHLRRRRGSGS